MARTRILPLLFLLADTLLVGQQVNKQDMDSALLTHVRSTGTNCPIGVQASLVGLPSVSNAGRSIGGQPTPPRGPSVEAQQFVQKAPPPTDYQQLHLDVNNSSYWDMVGAKFTVHGLSRKLRITNVSDPSNAPDLAKTVEVALDVRGRGHASSDLSLTHFAATITSIDLDSVTYANGPPWQASSQGACSIIPSRVMRIASTQ